VSSQAKPIPTAADARVRTKPPARDPARRSELPERNQLRYAAAAAILGIISSGNARPGSELRFAPLAEELDISTTPVREALLLLAQDGWVTQQRRGFRVAPIRRKDVEDTYFVRGFAASELAGRAAAIATAADVTRLRKLDEQIGSLREDETQRAADLNHDLHDAIYEISDSPRLAWYVAASSAFVPRPFWPTIPGWSEHNRLGHRAIINQLEYRDADGARSLMATHIQESCLLLLEWLDSISFWS
jgi:DNA-binding GntR family transcriptional regulator